jgi:hypothetical protein
MLYLGHTSHLAVNCRLQVARQPGYGEAYRREPRAIPSRAASSCLCNARKGVGGPPGPLKGRANPTRKGDPGHEAYNFSTRVAYDPWRKCQGQAGK